MAIWLTQTCAHCGQTYTPKRSNSVYCTFKCRVAAHRTKQPTAALIVACVVCGKEFETGRSKAVYCSRSCQGKAYRRRYAKWKKAAMMKSRPG